MTDHDLQDPLRRLAETAPAPAPGLAGDVVERGRTARRRRLVAVAVAGAAAVAALVVLVPVLGSGSTDRGAESPVVNDPTTPTEPPPPSEPSARMQVAAAGMRELLGGSYPTEDKLWVQDRVCEQDSFSRRGECTDLTDAEQVELEQLLTTYSITWVDRFPRDIEGKPYVQVSGLEDVSAAGGWVYVSAVRGGLDCVGAPFQVRIHQNGTPVAEQGNEFLIC